MAAKLVDQMLQALAYCHERHVCHRDLKLENFIFEEDSIESKLKLIDFGLSRVYAAGEHKHRELGTAYYVAPEVLKEEHKE